MSSLIKLENFDNFKDTLDYPADLILPVVLNTVRELDEREELEPYVRAILFDTNETPHGPVEIVDILTHKVTVSRETGLAAFILKGKSFPTVRHHQVAHQIYRLEKITGLRFAVFGGQLSQRGSSINSWAGDCASMSANRIASQSISLAILRTHIVLWNINPFSLTPPMSHWHHQVNCKTQSRFLTYRWAARFISTTG